MTQLLGDSNKEVQSVQYLSKCNVWHCTLQIHYLVYYQFGGASVVWHPASILSFVTGLSNVWCLGELLVLGRNLSSADTDCKVHGLIDTLNIHIECILGIYLEFAIFSHLHFYLFIMGDTLQCSVMQEII